MQTTSHFIGIELKEILFSDIFVNINRYLQKNNIEDIVSFQNPLSPHITLYYLEKEIKDDIKKEIKEDITKFNIEDNICISGFNYFSDTNGNKIILYLKIQTQLPLEKYRDILNSKYNRDYIEDNNYDFLPHITFLKIKNVIEFEKHRTNIEDLLRIEINKLNNSNINKNNCFLYAVNSAFKEEIQIKI